MAETEYRKWKRERAGQPQIAPPTSGKGKGKGRDGMPPPWIMRFKSQFLSAVPMHGVLLPKNPDDPWHSFVQRWHENAAGKRKPIISNSRNGTLDVPDLVYWHADMMKDGDLLGREQGAITFLVKDWFHQVKIANKKDPKKEGYTRLEPCLGTNHRGTSVCPMCDDKTPKQIGDRKYIVLNSYQQDQLVEELNDLPHRCASCFKGRVVPYAFECTECKAVILDRYKDKDATDADIKFLEENTIDCPDCGKATKPEKKYECVVTRGGKTVAGCDTPVQLPPPNGNVWEYEIDLISQPAGAGKSPNIVIETFKLPVDHQLPAYMHEPLDFDYFLRYMTLAEQAEIMGIQNPFGQAGEEELQAYFETRPAPSTASSEEADAKSIPWGSPPK